MHTGCAEFRSAISEPRQNLCAGGGDAKGANGTAGTAQATSGPRTGAEDAGTAAAIGRWQGAPLPASGLVLVSVGRWCLSGRGHQLHEHLVEFLSVEVDLDLNGLRYKLRPIRVDPS